MKELSVAKGEEKSSVDEYAKYIIDENGFLKITFNVSFRDKIKLLDAQAYVSIVTQMTDGTARPFLLNLLNFNNLVHPKIISFFAKNDHLQSLSTAKAFVVDANVYRIILKRYMKIIKQKYPIMVFKTEEEAIVWLKSVS